jgi:diguanylate cyclase (GGDEF)-like protein
MENTRFDRVTNLETHLVQSQTQREKIDALNDLAWELRDQQPERALILAQQASEFSTSGEFLTQPYNTGLAVSLTTRGYLNIRQEKLDLALDECLSAVDLLGTETPTRPAIDSLRVISWVYYFLGDYVNALSYGLKALDLSQVGGFKIQEARALDGLAAIHAASDDPQQALEEGEAALKLIREEHDESLEALVLNNIANILLEQGEYLRALEYSKQSLETVHRLDLNERRSEIADTLGQILQKMGEYERAEQLLAESLAMDIATQQELGQAYSLLSLGGLHLSHEKLELAESDFHKSLEIAIKIGARPVQMECYANLIEMAKRQGNWQQAFIYHESFHEIYKDVHIQTTSKRFSVLKLVHQVETARRDAEIYHLRNEELSREIEERKKAEAALQDLAATDPLTGLFNRRHFFKVAEFVLTEAIRYKHPLSIMILDIDHFKQVNDTYGHIIGDDFIKLLAASITKVIRTADLAARFGGDEFVILLPHTNSEQALKSAQRLQLALEEKTIAASQVNYHCTLSVGIASNREQPDLTKIDTLLEQADQALYRAKQYGRNQIYAWRSDQ